MKGLEQAIKELSKAERKKLAQWLYYRIKQGLEYRVKQIAGKEEMLH